MNKKNNERLHFNFNFNTTDLPFLSRAIKRTHYQPWYDDYADYNTNAKSYYDYLARFNKALHELADFVNLLSDRLSDVEDRLDVVEDRLDGIDDRLDGIDDRLDGVDDKLDGLDERLKIVEKQASKVDGIEKAVQKIINNLYESGAITGNDLDGFDFNQNRHIATGNINLFTIKPDGNTFIRTNKGKTDGDLVGGVD